RVSLWIQIWQAWNLLCRPDCAPTQIPTCLFSQVLDQRLPASEACTIAPTKERISTLTTVP
ncbi:hypothetical protein LEMLEM_LOCUS14120, partial [Lemmus lemmus]